MKQKITLLLIISLLAATNLPDPFVGMWGFQGNNGKDVEVYIEIAVTGNEYTVVFIDNNSKKSPRKEFQGKHYGDFIVVKSPAATYKIHPPVSNRMKVDIILNGVPGAIKSEYIRK